MELDMIVVLGLAMLFFGGIIYLIWKERTREKTLAAEAAPLLQESSPNNEKHNTKQR